MRNSNGSEKLTPKQVADRAYYAAHAERIKAKKRGQYQEEKPNVKARGARAKVETSGMDGKAARSSTSCKTEKPVSGAVETVDARTIKFTRTARRVEKPGQLTVKPTANRQTEEQIAMMRFRTMIENRQIERECGVGYRDAWDWLDTLDGDL